MPFLVIIKPYGERHMVIFCLKCARDVFRYSDCNLTLCLSSFPNDDRAAVLEFFMLTNVCYHPFGLMRRTRHRFFAFAFLVSHAIEIGVALINQSVEGITSISFIS